MKIRFIELGIVLYLIIFAASVTGAEILQNKGIDNRKSARIVAIGGAITEIVYALGVEKLLVGVDSTSTWPETAQTLPQVGYMRNLSAEGILSLRPTMVLATVSAGPENVLSLIKEAGISVLTIPEEHTQEGVFLKTREIAKKLDLLSRGEQVVEQIQSDFMRLNRRKSNLVEHPKVMFVLTMAHGSPLVSGKDTPADAMINLAGGMNAITNFSGFKPIGYESLIKSAPEYIILSQIIINSLGGIENFYHLPGIKMTPAGKKHQIIAMDTMYLLGFGPRTGQAALDLLNQLHPTR